MEQEHLFNPEQAPDQAIDTALTERAGLYYGRELLPLIEDQRFMTDESYCESLWATLSIKRDSWRRTADSPRRQEIGESAYVRKAVDAAGRGARKDATRKVRGSNLSPAGRRKYFAKREGKGRNQSMTFHGSVRWYEDHRAAFDSFVDKLGEHHDYLTGLEDSSPFASPVGPELPGDEDRGGVEDGRIGPDTDSHQ